MMVRSPRRPGVSAVALLGFALLAKGCAESDKTHSIGDFQEIRTLKSGRQLKIIVMTLNAADGEMAIKYVTELRGSDEIVSEADHLLPEFHSEAEEYGVTRAVLIPTLLNQDSEEWRSYVISYERNAEGRWLRTNECAN